MEDLELVNKAVNGDQSARTKISAIAHPIICYQASKFCKSCCSTNRYDYLCSLPEYAYPPNQSTNVMCEWGNGCYGWMLDDLTKNSRLKKYGAKNGASLKDYLFVIANSHPFKERWKDWRFGGKINVPVCVKKIHIDAAKVFYGLVGQHSVENIAQKMGKETTYIANIADQIIITLTQEKKLHVLNTPQEISLTGLGIQDDEPGQEHQGQIPFFDESYEDVDSKERMAEAWKGLDSVEQFVLEAMLIDEEDALAVIEALKTLQISIKKGISPDELDQQQLYYFRRKTIAKLSKLSGLLQ